MKEFIEGCIIRGYGGIKIPCNDISYVYFRHSAWYAVVKHNDGRETEYLIDPNDAKEWINERG